MDSLHRLQWYCCIICTCTVSWNHRASKFVHSLLGMFSVIAFGIDGYGAIGTGKVGLEGTTLAAARHVHLLWNRANKTTVACRRRYLLADPKWQVPNIEEHGDDFVQRIVGVYKQGHFVLCSSLADELSVFMVWLHSSGLVQPSVVPIVEELLNFFFRWWSSEFLHHAG
jgi:hypothetical protein